MAAQAVGEGDEEEDESVLKKYSKGISHVESLLALDRLRQVWLIWRIFRGTTGTVDSR